MYCRFLVQITIAIALLFTISFGEEHKNSSVETSQTQTPTTGSRHSGNSVPYQAPRSVSYPFGDEDMVNNNMLNKSAATEANCAEENEFIEYKPECTGPVDGTDELYVSCLKNELTVEPTDTIYSASKSASSPPVYLPSFMCKRCDLQKNSENTAVIIHCVHCYDQDNQSFCGCLEEKKLADLRLKMSRNLSEYDYREKLTFLGEYFDHDAYLKKKFILSFFPCDDTIEIFDRDLNRVYLKRSICDGIRRKDMFVGNVVRIYGRQISITDYGDCRTKEIIGKTKQRTFVLIKPSAMDKLGEVIADIESRDFQISRLRMCNLTRKQTLELYEHKKGDAFLPFILEHIVSGSVVALELVGTDAIERFKKEAGPNDPIEARKLAPSSLRAKYGQQTASNGFHCAGDIKEAIKEACFFFPEGIDKKPPETTVALKNSTCCIVKPHAVQEGKLGYILKEIYEGNFKITAMQMFYLSNANADEFLEVYKGVVSDFHALLLSFLDGPLVAMEISGKNEEMNVHKEFREFAGPFDPDIARQIRPYTLRAKFGNDKYKNAIHCTDLPEDTILELEYFFKILND